MPPSEPPDSRDPDSGSRATGADLSSPPEGADSLDALLGAAVRAPAVAPTLSTGDELLGRYRVEKLLGAGGMGTVYLATDRKLERQVAIKAHHGTAGTPRLRREAVAMARLAHPNVISVFEVGELGDQAFVVMEYVPGTTLRAWLGGGSRSLRERVAMLLGAGAGLAAAHDAGLVHRDFKPENVLVGDDGRPRVGDFGLARGSQSAQDSPLASHEDLPDSGQLATPLTRTGAVLGTPAYMAPEQAAGADVDPRADQFAFCVVAWELLYHERPFVGATLLELARAIGAGPRRPPRGTRVPPRIRRVLERGLAADPAARYADMHDLLGSLRRAARSRAPVIVAGVGLLATTAIAIAVVSSSRGPSCEDAGAEVETALPHALLDRLHAAGGPLAGDGRDRVAAALDAFARRYRAAATTACRAARIDHSWSDELYQRGRTCLAIRLRTAAAQLSIENVAAADIPDVVEIASQLPVLDGCVDPATLAASPVLPNDPARLEAEVAARAALDSARIDIALERIADARATLARLEHATVASTPAVAARILAVRAGVLRADDQLAASEQHYRDAYFAGRALDDVEVTLPAVAALIQSTGELREDHAAADGWIRNGLADADRARTRAPQAASAVYAIAARVRLLEDQLPEATRLGQLAVSLVDGTRSLALADALDVAGQVACSDAKYDACFRAQDRAIALTRELLGRQHPRVAGLLAATALERSDGSHPEALEFAREAKAIVDASGGSSNVDLAHARTTLAVMIINNDQRDQFPDARHLLEDARARLAAALGARHPDIAQIDGDLALLDNADGKLAEGAARLKSALAIQEHTLGPRASRVADTLYNLAATLRDLHRYDEALAASRRAVDINAERRAGTMQHALSIGMAAAIANLAGDPAGAYTLATSALALPITKDPVFARGWAEMEAGRALIARHADLGYARSLLEDARGVFAQMKLDDRVQECASLLARIPR